MAEIAFETVVRLFIAIVVLTILVSLVSYFYEISKQKISYLSLGNNSSSNGPLIVDVGHSTPNVIVSMFEMCYSRGQTSLDDIDCYVMTNVDKSKLMYAASQTNFTLISKDVGRTVLVRYLIKNDTVVVE